MGMERKRIEDLTEQEKSSLENFLSVGEFQVKLSKMTEMLEKECEIGEITAVWMNGQDVVKVEKDAVLTRKERVKVLLFKSKGGDKNEREADK